MKKTLITVLAVGLVAILISGDAAGAELEKGQRELTFHMVLEHERGSGTYLAIMGEYGFMITSRHELGPVLSLGYSNPDSPTISSSTSGGAGVFYRYNFPIKSKMLLPFVGGRALGFFGDMDYRDSELQAEIGIRVMPSPGASVNLAVYYREAFQSDPPWWDEIGPKGGVTAGVSIFF